MVGPSASRAKILVVDDETEIASTLSHILEEEGYQTAAAFDGRTAITLAKSFKPDLLLTDVQMPKVNGIEAAIEITSELPNCRVLLLTGSYALAVEHLRKAKAQGYDFPVMEKPFAPDELISSIKKALRKRGSDLSS
jgi:CheY-like chemotaxis protein